MTVTDEYFELTRQYQNEYGMKTVVLLQIGSFLEVYAYQDKTTGDIWGSEIVEFSRICDLNIAHKKNCVSKDNIIMAGFQPFLLEKYLKKLQDACYTVVCYYQDEQVKNSTRSLAEIYSPGTYFSSNVNNITNNITCIWIHSVANLRKNSNGSKMVHVGISNVDVYTGKTSIFEFKEMYIESPTTFDELERFISIYCPSEVIMIGNITEKEMDNIVGYANIECGSIHRVLIGSGDEPASVQQVNAINAEKQVYQKEILERFYKIDDFSVFSENFYQYTIATQSFCYLLNFVAKHNPYLVQRIEEPIFENCSERLILANHSLKQLNIIEDQQHKGAFSSVEKMLNKSITAMGKRRFAYQFLNPTTNVDYLEKEYEITEHALKSYDDTYTHLKKHFQFIKDISKMTRQIILKKISPKMLNTLYTSIQHITNIHETIVHDETIMQHIGLQSETTKEDCLEIMDFLDTQLDMSLCDGLNETQNFDINFFKRGVDVELDNKMEVLMESEDILLAIQQFFNNCVAKYEKKPKSKSKAKTPKKMAKMSDEDDTTIATATDFIKLSDPDKNNVIHVVSTKRRCLLLKQCFEDSEKEYTLSYTSSFCKTQRAYTLTVSKNILEFTHTGSGTSTSNEHIITPQIREVSKNISIMKTQMKELVAKIYAKFIDGLGTKFQKHLDRLTEYVTVLDVIYAKATLAKKYNYCRPVIGEHSTKSFVSAKGLRHCLIEHLQQNELYVTNDISLGQTTDGMGQTTDGMLLYGTNAVGKTSLIRALGIAVIMAQAGLFVPCSAFEYHPYKYIFTRILGNDNIFKGLSTFAVEMLELRTIMRLANENSLILGDELCSGTESVSAMSIFVAGIQKLHSLQSSFIFATHLHEITNYEEILSLSRLTMKHLTVLYDKENDALIYDRKLKDGPGNSMYGLEVCRALNLPDEFLEMAHTIRIKYHATTDDTLSMKTSHFNAKKIMSMCEMCNENMGKEVHHLQHQKCANGDGMIQNVDGSTFHKNNVANLMTLCEKCHDKMHKEEGVMHKKVKTTRGSMLTKV